VGPPGSGKTTFAQVVRRHTRSHFEAISAVLSGVQDLRELLRAGQRAAPRQRPLQPALHRRDPSL
jgi:replication-associated recombination protein RarA